MNKYLTASDFPADIDTLYSGYSDNLAAFRAPNDPVFFKRVGDKLFAYKGGACWFGEAFAVVIPCDPEAAPMGERFGIYFLKDDGTRHCPYYCYHESTAVEYIINNYVEMLFGFIKHRDTMEEIEELMKGVR